MIEAVLRFALHNRVLVNGAVLVLAILGAFALERTPIDALPDLSENQVIVLAEWPGHSPRELEDQVTRPLASSLRGLPHSTAVRATSEFGWSMLHVLFDDDVSRATARTRISERLASLGDLLPASARVELSPDASAVAQIFAYSIEGDELDLSERRSLQDLEVRSALLGVEGVAEVASVGGFVREIQVVLDPRRLAATGVDLGSVLTAITENHRLVDAGILAEPNGEVVVRGDGLFRGPNELAGIPLRSRDSAVLTLGEVAHFRFGPAPRRAILERDGKESVGGIVLMRDHADVTTVIEGVRSALARLAPSLPAGVRIVPFYDRTGLIQGAIGSLRDTLLEEVAIALLIVLLVLSHLRSAILVAAIIPLSILLAFLAMHGLALSANVMSLTGIALSIGVLIDPAIVVTESAHHAFVTERNGNPLERIAAGCRVVARPVICAVALTSVTILPLFALEGPAGRLFAPLAWAKFLVIVASGILAITWIPASLPAVLRAVDRAEPDNRLIRGIAAIYRPVLAHCLARPDLLLFATGALLVLPLPFLPRETPHQQIAWVAPLLAVIPIAWLARRKVLLAGGVLAIHLVAGACFSPLRQEFMPQLDEGTILDMPVSTPRLSVTEARDALLTRDALLRSFPEVAFVVGKAGRAETATDPSPLEMFETIVEPHARPLWPRRAIAERDAEVWAGRLRTQLVAASVLREAEPALAAAIDHDAATSARERFDDFARGFVRAEIDRDPAIDLEVIERSLLEAGGARFLVMLEESLEFAAAQNDSLIEASTPAERLTRVNALAAEFVASTYLQRKSKEELVRELDRVVAVPGFGNIWTQPIVNRVDMLATGIRSPLGIKLIAPDSLSTELASERLRDGATAVADCIAKIDGARHVFPEAVFPESQLEVVIDRDRAAALGVDIASAQQALEVAVGGTAIASAFEGRRRLDIRVRFPAEFAGDLDELRRIRVVGRDASSSVTFGEIAEFRRSETPSRLRSEGGSLITTIALDVVDRDIAGFVAEAKERIEHEVALATGFRCEFSGRFEQQAATREKLTWIVPAVLAIVLLLLHLAFRDLSLAGIMVFSIPGALAGGVLFQALFGFALSLPLVIGYLACFGLASATAIVMLVYLKDAIDRRGGLVAIASEDELREIVLEGAVKRLRPKFMTEATLVLGLLPMLFASGVGAEFMRPMAAPILGGILVADEVIDLLIPVLFHAVQRKRWLAARRSSAAT